MGFKEIIQKLSGSGKEDRNRIKELDKELRIQKLVEDRQKSSNERELERFMKEERESEIKQALEVMRKKRKEDIDFGHNPLNAENLITKPHWQVLKEKNMFSGERNMFANQKSVLKNNPRLMSNGGVLHDNKRLLKDNGGLFIK